MRADKNTIKYLKSVKIKASAGLDGRVHGGIDRTLAESQQTVRIATEPNLRRAIMRSPMVKIAVAAAVAIAAAFGIVSMGGGRPAFAKVIQPLLNARTVVFDFVVGDEATSPVIHDIVVGNRIRRMFSNIPTILVLDLDAGRMLTLDPASKAGFYMDIQGQLVQGTESILKLVREVVRQIGDHPDDVTDLGRRQINGRQAVGYQVKGRGCRLHIWADTVTATPVWIEMYGSNSVTILRNIQFDVPVDESLVSMDMPAGFTQQSLELSMGQMTEQDFVETLRIWAELLNNGTFPDQVSVGVAMQLLPVLGARLQQLDLVPDDQTRIGVAFGKGLGFLQMLDYQGQWHYAGKGVRFGDAGSAVFWYRTGDAKTYRVIYGDLRVEEVDLEHLPR